MLAVFSENLCRRCFYHGLQLSVDAHVGGVIYALRRSRGDHVIPPEEVSASLQILLDLKNFAWNYIFFLSPTTFNSTTTLWWPIFWVGTSDRTFQSNANLFRQWNFYTNGMYAPVHSPSFFPFSFNDDYTSALRTANWNLMLIQSSMSSSTVWFLRKLFHFPNATNFWAPEANSNKI